MVLTTDDLTDLTTKYTTLSCLYANGSYSHGVWEFDFDFTIAQRLAAKCSGYKHIAEKYWQIGSIAVMRCENWERVLFLVLVT
ncbi:hypothetical protein EYC84_010197 [Monilinia fructicola]|uniref:Uncharacterized protein n=1 Tax=Monilinia fructicola TaxID=38448 RepID=A0A5M9JFN7_MONFR|nr:hypothetical protein EYC84_010197 [Monilinia fructicola]